jgi:HEAT repeat protein
MAASGMGRARMMAAPQMGARGMDAPNPGGAEGLASRSAAAREEAVLDFEGDLARLAPLATEDASPAVRVAAVQRLADGETPVARAALRRALEDDDPDVLAEAILAVTAADDRKAVPALRKLRVHADEEVRGLAEDALASLAD